MKPSEMTSEQRRQYLSMLTAQDRAYREGFAALSPALKVAEKRSRTHRHASLLGGPGPDEYRKWYLDGRLDVYEFEDHLDRYYGLRGR